MKKTAITIILCVLCICCYAQQWYVEEQPADELKGSKRFMSLTCKLSGDEYFKCKEGEWDSFAIQTHYLIDYELEDYDPLGIGLLFGIYDTYYRYCKVKIGLYDSNTNLIKAFHSVRFGVSEKDSCIAFLKNSEIAEEVLRHLFRTSGYVRILVPCAMSENDMELIIPHYSHPKRK